MEHKEKTEIYDLVIVGAGPAGLTAALYASRAGLKVVMLEGMVAGGKVFNTSEVENWPGDKLVGGAELASRMVEHSLAFGAEQEYGMVEKIRMDGAIKEVETYDRVFLARAVLIASGTVERKLGIPGEDEFYGMGVSYCAVCDGNFYKNKTVTVIGGGNTAFEDSDYLSRFASQVHLVLRRDKARAEKILQERVARNPKIAVHLQYIPTEIIGEAGQVKGVRFRSSVDSAAQPLTIETDGIFPLIGVDPNTAFVADLPILDKEGYILTDADMATAIPGLYAAGDCRQKKLRQIVTAGNDGAIAAQAIAAWLEEHGN
ncbi:MAG: thioredoxin-disulfide reductase [Clostridia bacterium]|nr:thioredoxin-disulfide reductase [Clostridia bacterium]